MIRPVINRNVGKMRFMGVVKDVSDLRDRVMHSDSVQAYQLCYEAAGAFAYRLAERLFHETVEVIRLELMETCKHHGPCDVRFEVGYQMNEQVWEYTKDEQDERITKGIKEAQEQALLREAETQETDKRRFEEFARKALCTELSPAERQHLEDAARQFEIDFAGTPVIDAGFGIKLPKRTGDSPDGK